MSGRKDFLSQLAPSNYVAGLGRGATGFTTRSDLGPAREGPSEDQIKEALAKRAQQLGAAPPTAYGATEKKEEADDDDERYQDPENETGLFANGVFDAEDDYADRVYQEIDDKMQSRRKSRRYVSKKPQYPCPFLFGRANGLLAPPSLHEQITDLNPSATSREAREAQERAEYEANNPKIQQQFADLKRGLGSVSEDEWANLPEPGDLTRRNKRAKTNAHERFYAVPDSVIAGARDSTQFDTSVTDDGTTANGSAADGSDGTMTNFADIGAARDKVLQVRLDQAAQAGGADSTSGTATNIDPKGYLTSLSKTELKAGEVEVGDINRVRVLLESVVKTNRAHGPAYIAKARLEEIAGRVVASRQAIAEGTKMCPKSEAVWLEACRLNEKSNAKIIAANGIKANNQSVALWMEAIRLEDSVPAKRRVTRMAIDVLPRSQQLWKQLVNLSEDQTEAKQILSKAVEEIPLSLELWLALAHLEASSGSKVESQKILNKARIANPTSPTIWLAACQLGEEMGTLGKANIMKRAVQSLARENAMLSREEWIQEAEKIEDTHPGTAAAVIRETLGFGLDPDDEDLKRIFQEDGQNSISRGKYETARAIYSYALRLFPTSPSLWRAATDLEKSHGHGTTELWQLMEKSVESCPQAESLWIQYARSKWQATEVEEARRILGRAFHQNPNSESIWLQAVRLEAENKQEDQARTLLQEARQEAGTARVWWKSVHFERQLGNFDTAIDLCQNGLELYPSCAKLWMQKGQIYTSQNKIPQAREAYSTGSRACPTVPPLFLLWSRLEEETGAIVKARSVLDRGLHANPKSDDLMLESVRLEMRRKNNAQAKNIMSRSLQALPSSGKLLSENILHLEPRTQRKPRSLEAMKKCENDPILFVTVARIFWGERRLEKAASWFKKSVELDSDIGDSWAWYLKFLNQHGTDEKRAEVIERCKQNEPKHGEVWQGVAKDPKNASLGTEEVLKKVVDLLE
ncbi:hypothetical protein MMC28_003164 [Mycoblastus sanguinarius]|nr:hypothetical protein [Mycoblastus sanguinarius]